MMTIEIQIQTAYCPHCRAVTNVSVSATPTMVIKPGGKEKLVVSRAYLCESCGFSVRSEENEIAIVEGKG